MSPICSKLMKKMDDLNLDSLILMLHSSHHDSNYMCLSENIILFVMQHINSYCKQEGLGRYLVFWGIIFIQTVQDGR
jgi:hypothetical protein